MTRWALIVKQLYGSNHSLHWITDYLGEMTGTREQALEALWYHTQNFVPRHPLSGVIRRAVCREDDGFLVLNWGVTREYPCEFRIRELLFDSGPHTAGK